MEGKAFNFTSPSTLHPSPMVTIVVVTGMMSWDICSSNEFVRYQNEILRMIVRPYADAVSLFLLLQDNARPHVARVCRHFLNEVGNSSVSSYLK